MRTRKITTIDVDDIEVELEYNPEYFEPITTQPTPTTLVVGYLMYDEVCENPMTSCDCEGTLYTLGEGVITDDKSAPGKLGLTDFPGWRSRYPVDYDLELDGIEERVADKLKVIIKADPELTTWFVAKALETEDTFDYLAWDLTQDMSGYNNRYDWDSDEDLEGKAKLPDYETLAREAWEELYNEGKIGEYLAVPVYYCSSNHGPGTMSARTASLDDCNAVWVPDKCAIENMNFDGCATYLDKLAVADKYASGVLDQYQMWANGECYGIVVESFVLSADGDSYERVGDVDSCWGFVGREWAESELGEQMEWAAQKLLEEKEAA